MIRLLLYTVLGASLGFFYSYYWLDSPYATLLAYVAGGLLIGLVIGITLEVYQALYSLSQKVLENRRNVVIYRPAQCAWCKGKGKKYFLIFKRKCGACSGQGSVLVAEKSNRCGWCTGSGKGFLSRCPVCDGTGWAHSGIDKT